jgi:hypothetical protein
VIDANQTARSAIRKMIALLVTGRPRRSETRQHALRGRTLGDEVAKSAAARMIAILLGLP